MYELLITLSTLYTCFAVVFLFVMFVMRKVYGLVGFNLRVNKLAGSKNIMAFEVYLYVSVLAWVALMSPLFGAISGFPLLGRFEEGGLIGWFGPIPPGQGDAYFLFVFVNILGVKAAMNLAELAGMLRRGKVVAVNHGFFTVWYPYPER